MSTTISESLASHFFQVAYVVLDVAAAEVWFQNMLGVPSWFRMDNVEFGAACTFRGRPADSVAHLSIAYLRETQIELIEPVRGESLYAEFLESRGPGLHHVAFDVPDFSATVSALRDDGLEMLADGKIGEGTEFAYFDCDAIGASVIEILGFDPAIRAFMTQLKEQSAKAIEGAE